MDDFIETEPKKRSRGTLRRAEKKSKPKSPDYIGTMKLQRHTFEAIAKQFDQTNGDEIACGLAGWKNRNGDGPYVTVDLTPRFVSRRTEPTRTNLVEFISDEEE